MKRQADVPSGHDRLRFFKRIGLDDGWPGTRTKLRPADAARFEGGDIASTFARALCERGALPVKELFEATETFALSRKVLRGPVLADLCCGHGLAGAFFALMERDVERVILVDRERPPNADLVIDALDAVAPWASPKLEWRESRLDRQTLPGGTSVLAVHACGLRTDAAIEHAIAAGGPFAALPCCRPHRQHPAPEPEERSRPRRRHRRPPHRLEENGYVVAWRDILPSSRRRTARSSRGAPEAAAPGSTSARRNAPSNRTASVLMGP